MPRAVDLRLDTIKLAQNGRVLTATAVAPPLNFVTTEFIRDLDRLTTAVDTDDSVGAVVLTGGEHASCAEDLRASCSRGTSASRGS